MDVTQNPRGTIFVVGPAWASGGGSSRRMCRRSRTLYPQIDVRLRLSDRVIDVTAEGLDVAFHLGAAGGFAR